MANTLRFNISNRTHSDDNVAFKKQPDSTNAIYVDELCLIATDNEIGLLTNHSKKPLSHGNTIITATHKIAIDEKIANEQANRSEIARSATHSLSQQWHLAGIDDAFISAYHHNSDDERSLPTTQATRDPLEFLHDSLSQPNLLQILPTLQRPSHQFSAPTSPRSTNVSAVPHHHSVKPCYSPAQLDTASLLPDTNSQNNNMHTGDGATITEFPREKKAHTVSPSPNPLIPRISAWFKQEQ